MTMAAWASRFSRQSRHYDDRIRRRLRDLEGREHRPPHAQRDEQAPVIAGASAASLAGTSLPNSAVHPTNVVHPTGAGLARSVPAAPRVREPALGESVWAARIDDVHGAAVSSDPGPVNDPLYADLDRSHRRGRHGVVGQPIDHLELAEATTIHEEDDDSGGDGELVTHERAWILQMRGANGNIAREETLSGTMVIGRAPAARPGFDDVLCALANEGTLSRSHAVVTAMRRGIVLVDLDSTNGTEVVRADGARDTCRPARAVKIYAGDVVELGDVTLTVRRENEELKRC